MSDPAWSNWAGQQHCSPATVARPRHETDPRPRSRRCGGRRADDPRRRERPLVHRHVPHRRLPRRPLAHGQGDRRRPRQRARARAGRHPPPPPHGGPARPRTRPREPGRHRPADDQRRHGHRHARHGDALPQSLIGDRRRAHRPRRRHDPRPLPPRRRRPPARRAGERRRTRRDHRTDAADGARVPAAQGRGAPPARRPPRRLPRARRPARSLRVLRVPLCGGRPEHGERAHRRSPGAAPSVATVDRRRPCHEPRTRALLARGTPLPAARTRALAGDGAAPLARRAGRPQPSRVRLRAARPVHRDGVRHPAGARARGGARRPAAHRGAAHRRHLPDRGADDGRRRRLPLDGRRARHRLRRGAPVHRDALRAVLPRGGGDHGRIRRPPALGQAPLPDRGHAGAPLSRLGRIPGRPRRARSGRRLHQRLRAPHLGPPPMELA